jgi:hypothetical protein
MDIYGRISVLNAVRRGRGRLPERQDILLCPSRYQRFFVLTRSGGSAYRPLMNAEDAAMLPLLASFQKLSRYKRVSIPESQAFTPEQQKTYYDQLIAKYIGKRKLAW